ncbi:hypothetical protein cpu_00250 [Carboxydothermus pertinax]|uniref:Uncharacterized protein n=1 Tax=Carboxydothermus pertinax TaxID=870242 RepID=A0A1L8CRG5_9THEO|nr:hypothetical protein cpu_00250 [Carboxydothermus pertinax]
MPGKTKKRKIFLDDRDYKAAQMEFALKAKEEFNTESKHTAGFWGKNYRTLLKN